MSGPKAFDANGIQFGWDSTSITLAETCLRKYQYRMLIGWQSSSKSVHLLFGGWYASALEHFHKYLASGMSRSDALYDVISEALFETWTYPTCEICEGSGEILNEVVIDGKHSEQMVECPDCSGEGIVMEGGTPWQSGHNTKTRENLIRTIIWYIDNFEEDPAKTIILSSGEAAVEHSFALPVDNGLIFSGHLDRMVEYAAHPYVQDQKTTGSTITQRYFEGFSPDTQMSMYTWAGKLIFSSPVHGVMIDAAQIAVGFTRFERGFAFRTASQLEEWYETSMYHIEKARAATREQHFPMNRSACGNYGGCEFRQICSRSPEVRDNFLKGSFEIQPRWDPLEKR